LPGLPDGIFSNQKALFGYLPEGLATEDVGILYGYWNILQTLGIFCGY
jgi:hypothetical protein